MDRSESSPYIRSLSLYVFIPPSLESKGSNLNGREMYDLPNSTGKCWQGLRSVNDRALVWEAAKSRTATPTVTRYKGAKKRVGQPYKM